MRSAQLSLKILYCNVRRGSSHRLPPTALRLPPAAPPRPLPPASPPCFARQPHAPCPFFLRAAICAHARKNAAWTHFPDRPLSKDTKGSVQKPCQTRAILRSRPHHDRGPRLCALRSQRYVRIREFTASKSRQNRDPPPAAPSRPRSTTLRAPDPKILNEA